MILERLAIILDVVPLREVICMLKRLHLRQHVCQLVYRTDVLDCNDVSSDVLPDKMMTNVDDLRFGLTPCINGKSNCALIIYSGICRSHLLETKILAQRTNPEYLLRKKLRAMYPASAALKNSVRFS